MYGRTSEIFAVRCKTNKKMYIGATLGDSETRIRSMICALKRNDINTNKTLREDFNKYGENDFEFFVLEDNIESTKARGRLQYYMDEYKSTNPDHGYNYSKKKNTEIVIKKVLPELPK